MTKFLCVQALSSRTSTILCIRGEGKLEALGFIGFSVSELSKFFFTWLLCFMSYLISLPLSPLNTKRKIFKFFF